MEHPQNLFERFERHMSDTMGISLEQKILLAVSGGLDSVCMLHLMSQTSFPFAIAHANFKLRGEDSDGDQAFVQALARKYGVDFYTKDFDVQRYKDIYKVSTQMAARDLRYAWFEETIATHQYTHLAVAHHLNDHLETILFNITKGTGLPGLLGIATQRDYIIRPLKIFTREELEQYVHHESLEWREDSSNARSDYSRNFIRREVIPLLMQLNPSLPATVQRSVAQWEQAHHLAREATAIWKAKLWQVVDSQTIKIERQALVSHLSGAYLLFEWLKGYGFNFVTCADIVGVKLESCGQIFHGKGYRLVVDRNYFLLQSEEESIENEVVWEIHQPKATAGAFGEMWFDMQLMSIEAWKLVPNASIFQADTQCIEWPLRWRYWEKGDQFVPLGMKGRKKVSDLMIDAKIPVNLKRRQIIVCDRKGIVWVAGLHTADRTKISSATKEVVIIKANQNHDKSI